MPALPELLEVKYGQAAALPVWSARSVTAKVSGPGGSSFDSDGLLYVGPDGIAWVWLSPSAVPHIAMQHLLSPPEANKFQIRGELDDGRAFAADECLVENINLRGGTGDLVGRPADKSLTVQLHQPPTVACLLLVGGRLTINARSMQPEQAYRVSYTLLNAIFDGIESTRRDNGDFVFDRFSWTVSGRTWTAQWLPSYKGSLKSLRSGSFRAAPTATLSIDGVTPDQLDEVDNDLDTICWLMGIATGCMVTAPLRQLWDQENLVEERVQPQSPSTSARSNTSHKLISNHEPSGGLRSFLEMCHGAFVAKRESLGLTDYIGWLNQARSQEVIQMRVLATVLAVELITFKWVTMHGLAAEQAVRMNIETKLNRLRKDGMYFIEKKFTADDLRSDIRNPLMHTGIIPLMSFEELCRWSEDLYDLAFRILLVVLGYKGKYRKLNQSYQLVDAPQIQVRRENGNEGLS